MAVVDTADFIARRHERFYSEGIEVLDSDGVALDLTGLGFRMHVRDAYDGRLFLELSTANGMLIVTLPNIIGFDIPRTVIDDLPLGRYVHDIATTDSDNAVVTAGAFSVVGQSTK